MNRNLASMSASEIEESQHEIMEKLDPGFLALMKKRAIAKKEAAKSEVPEAVIGMGFLYFLILNRGTIDNAN
jgi:hypothetical protein